MAPEVVTIAGPNGSGKTTFAYEYLLERPLLYLSADAIAEQMATTVQEARITAGRRFLGGVSAAIGDGHSFLVESTLSGLTFRRSLRQMGLAGYEISIVFVYLLNADACVARILERVGKGGHPVAEADVRRRFGRSIRNFWRIYRPEVDRWFLYYNGGSQFHEVALGMKDSIEVCDGDAFAGFLEVAEGEIDGRS